MLLKWIYVFLLTYYIMLKEFSENNLEVIVTEVDIFQWRNNIVRGDFLLANKIKLVFSDVIVPKWPCCLLPSQLLRGVACLQIRVVFKYEIGFFPINFQIFDMEH